MVKFDSLLIGPGSTKGILFLGALNALEELDLKKNIKSYVGVSVGSIICLLSSIGYTSIEILSSALDMNNLLMCNEGFNIKESTLNKGILNNNKLKNALKDRISTKFNGKIPTLKQHYNNTNINIYIVAYNLTKKEPIYFNHETHPDVSCLDAILYSINIPLVFQERKYNGDIIIDGAFGDPNPIQFLDDGTSKVLCLFVNKLNDKFVDDEEKSFHNFINYSLYVLGKLFSCPINEINRIKKEKSSDNCVYITLNYDININLLGTSNSNNDKEQMFNMAYKQTYRELKS